MNFGSDSTKMIEHLIPSALPSVLKKSCVNVSLDFA
ncbi:hypothetical protein SAMN05444366_3964 [Flavobacterium saccharophilum]|uniref:Uncharacterized protein n=1 Tax=Flavobacterium saccharophilum TaxID=29534 RepID=A0A1M7L665_9FLAO|nr:hypothetical protein SAMN05444366_3964 [Flavobacterium saccharophilum]